MVVRICHVFVITSIFLKQPILHSKIAFKKKKVTLSCLNTLSFGVLQTRLSNSLFSLTEELSNRSKQEILQTVLSYIFRP